MTLSVDQQLVFNKYLNGNNIFITGSGGNGKTFLIQKIYAHAMENNKNIQVTATTGCAAELLKCNAKTIHSWSGYRKDLDLNDLKLTKYIRTNWLEVDILIVDEVSMLSLKMFEALVEIGNKVRKKINKTHEIFGGIQVIFSGDFYQIPPVSGDFCFQSELWFQLFHPHHHVQLKTCFRQNDLQFIQILEEIRTGNLSEASKEILLQKVVANSAEEDDDNDKKDKNDKNTVKPICIFPINSTVNEKNIEQLMKLPGELHSFPLILNGSSVKEIIERSPGIFVTLDDITRELNRLAENNNFNSKIPLQLKVGAQVMCSINIKNYATKFAHSVEEELLLCNGSQGIVQSFCSATGFPFVKFANGVERIMSPNEWMSERFPGVSIAQIPLRLSWAITIHKSQGATFDAAEIDIGNEVFTAGQMYVALSRVKTFENILLTSFNPNNLRVNILVKNFYSNLEQRRITTSIPEELKKKTDVATTSVPPTKKIKISNAPKEDIRRLFGKIIVQKS